MEVVKMKCPKCGSTMTIYVTWGKGHKNQVRRKMECLKCGNKFYRILAKNLSSAQSLDPDRPGQVSKLPKINKTGGDKNV